MDITSFDLNIFSFFDEEFIREFYAKYVAINDIKTLSDNDINRALELIESVDINSVNLGISIISKFPNDLHKIIFEKQKFKKELYYAKYISNKYLHKFSTINNIYIIRINKSLKVNRIFIDSNIDISIEAISLGGTELSVRSITKTRR